MSRLWTIFLSITLIFESIVWINSWFLVLQMFLCWSRKKEMSVSKGLIQSNGSSSEVCIMLAIFHFFIDIIMISLVNIFSASLWETWILHTINNIFEINDFTGFEPDNQFFCDNWQWKMDWWFFYIYFRNNFINDYYRWKLFI